MLFPVITKTFSTKILRYYITMFSLNMNALLEEKPPEGSLMLNLIHVNHTVTLLLLLRFQNNAALPYEH